jgi:hypothetical protein
MAETDFLLCNLTGRPAQKFAEVNSKIAQKMKVFFVQYSDLQN